MDALTMSILHTYKSSLLSLKAKWLWWGPSFFMQINYWYYSFLVFCIAWIHLFSILHLRICWELHSMAENSLLCMVSKEAKYYECALFSYFPSIPAFVTLATDFAYSATFYLKYKRIMHAIMYSKLKEPVADKVWRQHFHHRENFINKHKNPFSFNNITDLWNIWIKIFFPLVSIFTHVWHLRLEMLFWVEFPSLHHWLYYGEHHSAQRIQTAFLPDEIKLKDLLPACTQRTPTSGMIQSADQTRIRPSNPFNTDTGSPS